MITKEIELNLKFRFKIVGRDIKGALMAIEGLKAGNTAWVADIEQSIALCNSEGPVEVSLSIKEE